MDEVQHQCNKEYQQEDRNIAKRVLDKKWMSSLSNNPRQPQLPSTFAPTLQQRAYLRRIVKSFDSLHIR